MNKKYYWVLLSLMVLLLGCSSSKGLTKDEISKQVLDHQDEIVTYHADIKLDTRLKELSTGLVTQESNAFSDVTINEITLDSYGKIQSDNGQTKTSQEYYSIGEKAYLKTEGAAWMDVSAQQVEYFHNTSSFYSHLTPIVEILSKMGDVEERNKEYVFSFSGESVDVYQRFETPYNLRFANAEPQDIHQEIEVIIDKDTFFIKSVKNSLSAELSGNILQINISHVYDHINDIDDFVIPQKVIDEAKP